MATTRVCASYFLVGKYSQWEVSLLKLPPCQSAMTFVIGSARR